MKYKILSTIVLSMVLGTLITWVFTAQMHWEPQDNCIDENAPISSNVSKISCSGLEYGYPFKFMKAESSVSQSFQSQDTSGPLLIGISSQIEYNQLKLLANVLFWSVFSMAILSAIIFKYFHKKPAPKE